MQHNIIPPWPVIYFADYRIPLTPMPLSPQIRNQTSWFVLIAFFFATLAPSLGMAAGKSAASQAVWAQLCSADGPRLVAIDANGDPATAFDDAYGSHSGHCLLCFHPSTPPPNTAITPVAGSTVVLRLSAPTESQGDHFRAWSTPLPRAPPTPA